MGYNAVLFDLDGVVIDSNPEIIAFWKGVAADYGVILQESDFIQYIYGCPARETLSKLFSNLNSKELERVYAGLVTHEMNLKYREIPGATAFLRALRENGVPTALVTSGELWKVREVFAQLGIAGLFTVLVTAEDIQNGKPNPECYRLAVERLGLTPEKCLVFEDAVSGVRAAVDAGANCIGLQQPECAELLLRAGALRVIPNFTVLNYQISSEPLKLVME